MTSKISEPQAQSAYYLFNAVGKSLMRGVAEAVKDVAQDLFASLSPSVDEADLTGTTIEPIERSQEGPYTRCEAAVRTLPLFQNHS